MRALITLTATTTLAMLSACSEKPANAPQEHVKIVAEKKLPPRDIAGITIGRLADLPECGKKKSYGQISYETFPTNVPCWAYTIFEQKNLTLSPTKKMPKDGKLQVQMGQKNVPEGVYDVAEIEVIAGKIERIELKTFGADYQSDLLVLLTKKWGNPSISNVQELQNGFGAKYKGIEAQWLFDGMSVAFFGILGNPEDGFITVRSATAIEHENKRRSEHASSF